MRPGSYEAHRHARKLRARLMRLALRRAVNTARRWRHGLNPSAWLRPLSYG